MRSKIKGKSTKISSPFDTTAHKTERAAVGVMMHWMREIIEDKGLDLGLPDVDTSGPDGKFPDTVIYESRRSKKVLCVIEAKPPYYDVFDEKELKEPARTKATKRKATYFVTTNFKKLIWFNLEKVNAARAEEEQVIQKYSLSEVEDLDSIEGTAYKNNIKRGLEQFISRLYLVYTKKEIEPKQAIDEFLVFRLREKIRVLSAYYKEVIYDQCHKDSKFAEKLKEWFREQVWTFAWQPQDFDKAARQTAYLLVNKILFYNVLQAIRPADLEPLDIPKSLFKGESLQAELQKYFGQVLKIDYETIYTTDFIDSIAFPDAKEIIEEVKELISVLRRYDFSTLGYDIIGRIFEQLIPQEERHNLGQYFTNADVVDIILKFCLNHEDDKLLDPACGAGTFLVRAYQHKKLMNQYKGHEEILKTLWGDDIAKFPATLSIINLAINDLEVSHNYPNILCEDFFDLLVDSDGFKADEWRKRRAKTLNKNEREVTYPRWFDAVVGNPPYTRQEEIAEISHDSLDYKKDLIKAALYNSSGKIKLADIGKRAGIYAYFFVHGIKFLKDKGYFGFIVSNAWMDVDYGKGLQEFFLENYKIITIIESKVERWFEEADINTCIIILQKCKNKEERDENLVRFVYLKKPLRHFVPPAKDMWEKQIERLKDIDKLKKTILAHNEIYESDDLRIFPKQQSELWEEGFDTEKQKYDGAKWGKYLRGPQIFFKILKKGKAKLVPLKRIATVQRGYTTNANAFFYLTNEDIKRLKIEKEFWMHQDEKNKWTPNYIFRHAFETKSIIVNPQDLNYRVLLIDKEKSKLKGTKIINYISKGEKQKVQEHHKGSKERPWYDLGRQKPGDLFYIYQMGDRFIVFENLFQVYADCNLFNVYVKDQRSIKLLSAILNSTVSRLLFEMEGRQLTGSLTVLKTQVYELLQALVINPALLSAAQKKVILKCYGNLCKREILSLFAEMNAFSPEEVSLDKVKPDRRELDKIVMGEILGLTDDEQLEVYQAVVDLIKSRLEKAKSVSDRKKTKEGIDIDAFLETVLSNIGDVTLGKFYKDKILTQKHLRTKKLPEGLGKVKIEELLQGWRVYSGKKYVECDSEAEARYLKVFIGTGINKVRLPGEDILLLILPQLEKLRAQIDSVIDSYLESIISSKTRILLQHCIWTKLLE